MDLSGTWDALVVDEDLRRTWSDPAAAPADESWEPVPVPGHWRSVPAFADSDGPLLYRTRFEHPTPGDGRRLWLLLDGMFYMGDVWLDAGYLGDTEGYFFPHGFDITDALAARGEHTVGVEVACAPQRNRSAKRNITGVFQHWDCLDPDWNPGGLWRPVRIEETGPVRIRTIRAVCLEATPERAVVALHANLDAVEPCTVHLRTSVAGSGRVDERSLAAGENHVEWTVTVADPDLWWPHALGPQPLHQLVVEAVLGAADDGSGGEVSHLREKRIGLRQVSLRNWVMSVNGERLFLKGSNQGPTRMALAEATPEEVAGDVALAVDAGLDLLRVHAHIARDELYDAADEAGLLVWQDFPLQWGYSRAVKGQAVRQAARAVDVLGHHPSVAVWCGHNEPFALDAEPGAGFSGPRVAARFMVGQQLPTWNKSILDRAVKRALNKTDGSRPVIPHSGVLPHLPQLDGTDSHTYFGWYHGQEREFPAFARLVPRMVRFVTEFGAQAVPTTAGFMEPERWPDLDWERLGHSHALQKESFDQRVPPADHATFASWQEATQAYQATVVKHHVETLRRLKYRPTGGFAQFCFADGHPSVTWAVLGHDRVPKAGFTALQEACRPVIVVADRLPATVAPGNALALDVHVVSDLREPVAGAELSARLRWVGGERTWSWGGDIPADACVRVATLSVLVPDAPGALSLDLTLAAGDHPATNRYTAIIA